MNPVLEQLQEVVDGLTAAGEPFEVGESGIGYALTETNALGAVFSLPDEGPGETVGAAVVLRKQATLDEAAPREFLAGHLSGFKIPAPMWVSREPLPRIASGKIFKRDLQAIYARELAALATALHSKN